MTISDLFEDMRPVATVWKRRGDKIERGRMSRFVVNAKPLTKIGPKDEQEKEPNSSRPSDKQSVSSKGIEKPAR